MMHYLSIRPFEVQDQEAARQLILSGLGEHFGYIDESRNPDIDDIMKHYIMRGHIFIVAYLAQILVGTGGLVHEEDRTGRIVRISAHNNYRRKGIGKTIVEHLLARAQMLGYRKILVETNNGWEDAIGLYKRLAFVEVASTDEGVHMALELSARA